MANVTIKNVDRLVSKFNKMANLDVRDAMNKAVTLVHGEAKSLAPVDTGELAGSIHMDVNKTPTGLEGRVYTNNEYAMYVEFGTGIKGNGTYPYKVEGLTLSYKDKGWSYIDERTGERIYTRGQVAQPYMYPSLNNNKKAIKKLLKDGTRTKLQTICRGGK